MDCSNQNDTNGLNYKKKKFNTTQSTMKSFIDAKDSHRNIIFQGK